MERVQGANGKAEVIIEPGGGVRFRFRNRCTFIRYWPPRCSVVEDGRARRGASALVPDNDGVGGSSFVHRAMGLLSRAMAEVPDPVRTLVVRYPAPVRWRLLVAAHGAGTPFLELLESHPVLGVALACHHQLGVTRRYRSAFVQRWAGRRRVAIMKVLGLPATPAAVRVLSRVKASEAHLASLKVASRVLDTQMDRVVHLRVISPETWLLLDRPNSALLSPVLLDHLAHHREQARDVLALLKDFGPWLEPMTLPPADTVEQLHRRVRKAVGRVAFSPPLALLPAHVVASGQVLDIALVRNGLQLRALALELDNCLDELHLGDLLALLRGESCVAALRVPGQERALGAVQVTLWDAGLWVLEEFGGRGNVELDPEIPGAVEASMVAVQPCEQLELDFGNHGKVEEAGASSPG